MLYVDMRYNICSVEAEEDLLLKVFDQIMFKICELQQKYRSSQLLQIH